MKRVFLLAIALGMFNAAPGGAADDGHGVSPALLKDLNVWLDAETEFARRDQPPKIEVIGPARAEALYGIADRSGGRLRGLYDADSGTIYLTAPWSPGDPRDVSVLLHEIVHHRQAGKHWYCEQAQEWRAYQIQAQWLNERQIDDGFYWPAILLQSSCTRRDIHPS